jgi:hypothetical protein
LNRAEYAVFWKSTLLAVAGMTSKWAMSKIGSPNAADEGYWRRCFFGDDFGHSAMFPECPALSGWDLFGGRRGLDASPSAMGWKADHGVSNTGTGTAGLAGGVAVGR